jgi:hypothetical protein
MSKRKNYRPFVETLEDRCLPSISLTVGSNVNISQMPGVQAEGTIAVDPTNPQRLFSSSVNYVNNPTLLMTLP